MLGRARVLAACLVVPVGRGFMTLGRAGAECESVWVLAPPSQPLRRPIAPGIG